MATPLTNTTFATTYKDDFADSDNYHRILFNAGRALQARELTQLQTIIQAEVGRFARNIFNEGAVVNPGGVTVDNRYEYIKLAAMSVSNTPNVGDEWYSTDGKDVRFRVLRVEAAGSNPATDPPTLYVQYIKTRGETSGTTGIRIGDGVGITNGSKTLTVAGTLGFYTQTGVGTLASVGSGEYFTQNHFVYAAQQSILVSRYSGTPTVDLGFLVTEDIVTVEDTNALYDNQGAVPNLASPGADRYRIRLTLTTRDLVDSAEHFLFIARIVDGKVSFVSSGTTEYNKINELLALRTKEESGDYIVKPFSARASDLNDSQLELLVEPGVAYVDGYRLETPLSKLTVQKARDTISVTDGNMIPQYGNYVVQDSDTAGKGIPNIESFAQVNLRSAIAYGGVTIGTARVRAGQRFGSKVRYYLLDVRMNAGQKFSAVRSFGTSVTSYVDVELTDGIAVLQETGNNSLLFPLPHPRPEWTSIDIPNNQLKVQVKINFNPGASTSNTQSAPTISGYSTTFTDPGDWIISQNDDTLSQASGVSFSLSGSPSGSTVDISGLTSSQDYELLAYVTINDPQVKSKTLTSRVLNQDAWALPFVWPDSADTDSGGLQWITLDRADVYDITSIRINDSNGTDISDHFTFDNGQRDNFYDRGRLIKKPEITVPSGNIFVRYRYFEPTGGHYFSAKSYQGSGITYNQIPSHTKNDGEVISLRDVLDFRSLVDSTGVFVDNDTLINRLPENGDNFTVNADYYLPRKDRVVIKKIETDTAPTLQTNRAEVKYIQGVSSFNPVFPDIPAGSMLLYNYSLGGYTLNDSDLSYEKIQNRGYTMKDIGRLDRRLTTVEELTSLNLLEINTESILVLDSAGNPRTKSGFLADNFNNLSFAELSPRYRATVDQADKTLMPLVYRKNVRLLYDSDANEARSASVQVQRSGDLITLPYTHTTVVNQNIATEAINVNPFSVIRSTGVITLSPSSDEWVEIEYAAEKYETGDTVSNVGAGQLRQALQNGWTGSPGQFVIVGDTTTWAVDDDKETVLDVQVIPWMRSRRVYFRATNLRPQTRYFPYFNNVAVDNWVRGGDDNPSVTFRRFGQVGTYEGNIYRRSSGHPDGGGQQLYSDAAGILEGEFYIPSTPSLRFRTGVAEFKLLDVSGNSESTSLSRARAHYRASGILETRQKTFVSTRHVTVERVPEPPDNGGNGNGGDPLAQTFYVDPVEYPSGMFLTKAEIYVATKDAALPLFCEIVTIAEGGTPTQQIVPGGRAYLLPSDISTPVSQTLTAVRNAGSTFVFEEPVYLSPGRQYALVLRTENTNYTVYVAKTYDFILGTSDRRVTKQPTLGTLYLSQNSAQWTPDQTRDLMFKLYRAQFDSSGELYLENGSLPLQELGRNPLRVDNADSDVTFSFQGHGFATNDLVRVVLPTSFADSFGGISDSAIGDSIDAPAVVRVVRGVDWSGFKIGAVTTKGSQTANTTLIGGGEGIIVEQQAVFDEFYPVIQTLRPDQTTISATAKFTSAKSYAGARSTGSGTIYTKDGSFSSISINDMNYNTSPKIVLSSRNETAKISGDKSATIKLDLATTNNAVSPVIDLQRTSLILTENVIDKQDSASTNGYNVPLNFVDETDPTGGSTAAKHITKQINLENPAVGLKILIGVNRPTEATVKVYYKTGNSEDVLDNNKWIEIAAEADIAPDNDRSIFREYEYLPGGIGGNLPAFTKYQVKIVMESTNSSRPPKIKDLRVIALAV